MATGTGKTQVAIDVTQRVDQMETGRKFLFLVPSQARYSRVLAEFESRAPHLSVRGLGCRSVRPHFIKGKNHWDYWDVSVADYASAVDAFQAGILIFPGERFFCVFVDEAHLVSSHDGGWGEIRKLIKKHSKSYVYMTATPHEEWELDFSPHETFYFPLGRAVEEGIVDDYCLVFIEVDDQWEASSVTQAISAARKHLPSGSLLRTVSVSNYIDATEDLYREIKETRLYSATSKFHSALTSQENLTSIQRVSQDVAEAVRKHPPKQFGTMLICIPTGRGALVGQVKEALSLHDGRLNNADAKSPKFHACASLKAEVRKIFGRGKYGGTVKNDVTHPTSISHDSVMLCCSQTCGEDIDVSGLESVVLSNFKSLRSQRHVVQLLGRCLRPVTFGVEPEPDISLPIATLQVQKSFSTSSISTAAGQLELHGLRPGKSLSRSMLSGSPPDAKRLRVNSMADVQQRLAAIAREIAAAPEEHKTLTFEQAEATEAGGYVYVIRQQFPKFGGPMWHTVGKTVNVARKIRALQTGNALELEIVVELGPFENAVRCEQLITEKLRRTVNVNNRGWFLVSPSEMLMNMIFSLAQQCHLDEQRMPAVWRDLKTEVNAASDIEMTDQSQPPHVLDVYHVVACPSQDEFLAHFTSIGTAENMKQQGLALLRQNLNACDNDFRTKAIANAQRIVRDLLSSWAGKYGDSYCVSIEWLIESQEPCIILLVDRNPPLLEYSEVVEGLTIYVRPGLLVDLRTDIHEHQYHRCDTGSSRIGHCVFQSPERPEGVGTIGLTGTMEIVTNGELVQKNFITTCHHIISAETASSPCASRSLGQFYFGHSPLDFSVSWTHDETSVDPFFPLPWEMFLHSRELWRVYPPSGTIIFKFGRTTGLTFGNVVRNDDLNVTSINNSYDVFALPGDSGSSVWALDVEYGTLELLGVVRCGIFYASKWILQRAFCVTIPGGHARLTGSVHIASLELASLLLKYCDKQCAATHQNAYQFCIDHHGQEVGCFEGQFEVDNGNVPMLLQKVEGPVYVSTKDDKFGFVVEFRCGAINWSSRTEFYFEHGSLQPPVCENASFGPQARLSPFIITKVTPKTKLSRLLRPLVITKPSFALFTLPSNAIDFRDPAISFFPE
eukprot:GILJ01011751.1.p1 GENE.GILJ01011751.1~~GILJ01011751.1.p1  ORF type:complete len:1166 (-),score=62.32 GILJ01011751.1:269-3637(-)